MNLAALYNLNKTAADEHQAKLQKLASEDRTMELFSHWCRDNKIDVKAMDDAAVEGKYAEFVEKLAAEESDDKGGDDKKDDKPADKKDDKGGDGKPNPFEKKKEAAYNRWAYVQQEKQAAQRSRLMGQNMAFSLIDTLQKIAKGEKVDSDEAMKTAAAIDTQVALKLAGAVPEINDLAFHVALDLVKQANANNPKVAELVDGVADQINSLFKVGKFDESETKIAHVLDNFESTVTVRAYEMLEQAGIPVNWEKVLG